MKITKTNIVALSLLLTTTSIAMVHTEGMASLDYSQSIQILNLLGNGALVDPGMTATPIIVKYYNGNGNQCWVTSLNYQSDTTVHAGGSGLGCAQKITEIVISPVDVAGKLHTYKGPLVLSIDTSKFAHQLTIIQDAAPEFDTLSGLVVKPGTIKYNIQSLYRRNDSY